MRQNGHREDQRQLVGKWEQLVAEIEAGYQLNLDDYENDLTIRGLIDDRRLVDAALQQRVAAADGRFRAATYSPGPDLIARLWAGAHEDSNAEWYEYRLPKRLVGELAEDIGTARNRGPA